MARACPTESEAPVAGRVPSSPPAAAPETLGQRVRNLFVAGADNYQPGSGGQERRYVVLRRYAVVSTALVAVSPLLFVTWLTYHQFEKAYRADLFNPITRATATAEQAAESFLAERRAALEMVVNDAEFDELADQTRLRAVLANLAASFGGFVDLGVIDSHGTQRAYAGPYELVGKEYADQEWFTDVSRRGVHVSSVFLGHRGVPHFVIAVRHGHGDGDWHVLRATVDSEELNRRILAPSAAEYSDVFLVNREGRLQSPSRLYGPTLGRIPLAVPAAVPDAGARATELRDADGEALIVGHAFIEQSPFVLVIVHRPRAQVASWQAVRGELALFLAVSVVLIFSVIWVGSTYMIKRVRDADRKRSRALHQVEYTNRMATLGRLAAGVAHEVNNPLAIINEKAGLLQDLIERDADCRHRERYLALVGSVIGSVERASRVTHRLLGFARHVDVRWEAIELEGLIREVLGFLEREAEYRSVRMSVRREEDLPAVTSDRGQLQQVFLNIVNNALAAVTDGSGRIDIELSRAGEGHVRATVTDNGTGIEKANLSRIFEPFFTTRKGYGTGLGLSVTYGIVQKLGGTLEVDSELGQWTTFRVTLPMTPPAPAGGEHE